MFEPLRSHLYALQLLEYEPKVFWDWWQKNLFFFPQEIKGRLGWSAKARFLYDSSILIQLIISTFLAFLVTSALRRSASLFLGITLSALFFILFDLFPGFLLLTSLTLLKPYENLNRRRVMARTRRKIAAVGNLKVIGVTGSFGKTSVKEILKQILAVKFKVVAPPGSHNKIFSIAAAIDRELNSESEILIVEMGAYQKGEIAQICQMVKPQISILTGITGQHLMRFETLENIKKTKYELIESLPLDGFAFFNLDNEGGRELYRKCSLSKSGYSLKETQVEISVENTYFTLFGQKVKTTLLGAQNVGNILAAVEVSRHLGLSEAEIIKTIPLLHPIPHRLELVRASNNALILDDAYSSNVEGYQAAFELVGSLESYPKILVTPGLVELGQIQFGENVKMAQAGSKIFDYAVVVNRENRDPLVSGFLSRGWTIYEPERDENPSRWSLAYQGVIKDKIIFTADSLKEATEKIFPKITKPKSLILLESDLPDIYR